MDALRAAIATLEYYETVSDVDRGRELRQRAQTYALVAIAQALWRMDERAEAAAERADLRSRREP